MPGVFFAVMQRVSNRKTRPGKLLRHFVMVNKRVKPVVAEGQFNIKSQSVHNKRGEPPIFVCDPFFHFKIPGQRFQVTGFLFCFWRSVNVQANCLDTPDRNPFRETKFFDRIALLISLYFTPSKSSRFMMFFGSVSLSVRTAVVIE